MSVAIEGIYKAHRTTIDGAFSITFEASEQMADQINEVYRMRNEALYVVVMTEAEFHANTQVKTRRKRDG
jgi:hypothetical protein